KNMPERRSMAARKRLPRKLKPSSPHVIPYALEQLFVDQDRDWVTDTIAPMLAWVPGKSKKRLQQPFRFEVEHIRAGSKVAVYIDLTWSDRALEELVPGVRVHVRRL